MTDGKKDSVADAQARVDVERERLAATIAEIRRRADPRTLVAEVREDVTDRATHIADGVSRIANQGIETVKRDPAVSGAAVGAFGLIAALFAWRGHARRQASKRMGARLATRASVSDVLDPPDLDTIDLETTAADLSSSALQETDYAQEQHQPR